MQHISNDSFGAHAQLVLGTASSSSSSLLDGGFSRPFIRFASKPSSVVALIKNRISTRKLRKLTNMELHKDSGLRAQFKAMESNSQGHGKPVISAPFVAFQQHPLANTSVLVHENLHQSSQPPFQYSKLGQQHEALGAHPVHVAPEGHFNGGVRGENIQQLCKDSNLSRDEQDELIEAITALELQIEDAKVSANMYVRQARRWEDQCPVPHDSNSLPQMLKGLYTVMIWMQQRIQTYETMYPALRERYDAERGLVV
ncbi:golgi apyrase [Fusarium longipes]|uniref:Golgi apyrase n=1 Tax=Fusarium longipes TaxID=694270 RepID=A0A395S1W4_9HYPO|nr:golgi apyrase [Fusarium longipes]